MEADDTYVDLFGDFKSDDEAPSPARSPAPSIKRPPSPVPVAAEAPAKKRRVSDGDRQRKAKVRGDIANFYELEAQEGHASEDEDEGDLEDLIDYGAQDVGTRGVDQIRRHAQRDQRQELEELRDDMASRGKETGARRVFGSAVLDRLEERYRKAGEEMDEGRSLTSEQDQQATAKGEDSRTYIVPNEKDPKLWYLKTMAPEKELCISLLLKAGECAAAGKEVPIFSVFHAAHLKGHLYVEAHKESDVRDFCKGIRGISPWYITKVPESQMPLVYSSAAAVASKQEYIKIGDWVRMRRGVYAGDLAQVEGIDDQEYFLRMKPRLDLAGTSKGSGKGKGATKKPAVKARPPLRWFNVADVERHLVVNSERFMTPKGPLSFYVVDTEKYRDGFCYKSLKPGFFDHGADKVRPQEHELQDWRMSPPIDENTRPKVDLEQPEAAAPPAPPPVPVLAPRDATVVPLVDGDAVIVIKGDMKNLRGKVVRATPGDPSVQIQLRLSDQEPAHLLSIQQSFLNKYFEAGDRVQVLEGDHQGDIGVVVRVKLQKEEPKWGMKATAVVINEALTGEFDVRLNYLRRTHRAVRDDEKVGEFKCGQMVRVDSSDVGIVTRIEVGSRAMVLNYQGERKTVGFSQLEPMPAQARETFATDRKGVRFARGSTVKAPRTLQRTAPIRAEVIYIHGLHCFLLAKEYLVGDKSYLVCASKKVEYEWRRDALNLTSWEKAEASSEQESSQQGKISYGITMASQIDWRPEWFKQMNPKGSSSGKLSSGESIMIQGGQYKGYRGEVRKEIGDKALISLLAVNKLVTVPKEYIAHDKLLPKANAKIPVPIKFAPPTPKIDEELPGLPLADEAADDAWDPNYNPAPVVPVGGDKGGEDLPDGADGSLPRITDKDAAGSMEETAAAGGDESAKDSASKPGTAADPDHRPGEDAASKDGAGGASAADPDHRPGEGATSKEEVGGGADADGDHQPQEGASKDEIGGGGGDDAQSPRSPGS